MPSDYNNWVDPMTPLDRARERHVERRQRLAAMAEAVTQRGARLTPTLLVWHRWFIDESIVDPPFAVRLLSPDTRSATLVGANNAVFISRPRVVVIEPIQDEITLSSAAHEAGHARTFAQSKIARETAAWRWARQHCPVWTVDMQMDMRASLTSYLRQATRADLLDVLDAERACSQVEYRHE